MSGLLDDLRIDQSVYPGLMSYAHNCALDAVRDLLRSDETVERLSYIAGSAAAREFLAALAGGDQ